MTNLPAGAGMASPVVSASEAKKALEQGDSLAAMEAFTRMAAEKDKARPQEEAERREGLLNETSFDRRRQLAVYRKDGKKGHHMQASPIVNSWQDPQLIPVP